jgi:hypothetical protein
LKPVPRNPGGAPEICVHYFGSYDAERRLLSAATPLAAGLPAAVVEVANRLKLEGRREKLQGAIRDLLRYLRVLELPDRMTPSNNDDVFVQVQI